MHQNSYSVMAASAVFEPGHQLPQAESMYQKAPVSDSSMHKHVPTCICISLQYVDTSRWMCNMPKHQNAFLNLPKRFTHVEALHITHGKLCALHQAGNGPPTIPST